MRAAVSPTSCLSIPRTTTSVGCGTSKSIPSGASMFTGCEYPRASTSVFPLQVGPVADALDLEAPLEAVGDPFDHVRDQAPGEAVQRPVLAAVGGPLDG